MFLIGAIGWGLLAWGASSHLTHPKVLADQLGAHMTNPRPAALALIAAEAALAAAIPIAALTGRSALMPLAVAAGMLGVGFTFWVLRLLSSGSTLPCACSFSAHPPTRWSLVRALAVVGVAGFAVPRPSGSAAEMVLTLVVGLAVGGAIYVLPEALQWPPALRAQMARFEPGR